MPTLSHPFMQLLGLLAHVDDVVLSEHLAGVGVVPAGAAQRLAWGGWGLFLSPENHFCFLYTNAAITCISGFKFGFKMSLLHKFMFSVVQSIFTEQFHEISSFHIYQIIPNCPGQ